MHVFHDPTGRRSARVRRAGVIALSLTILLGGSFAAGVLLPPPMELLPVAHRSAVGRDATTADAPPELAPRCADGDASACAPMRQPRRVHPPAADPIIAAFAVQWDPASRASLERIGERLDWVIVEGAFLGRGAAGDVSVTLDPDLSAAARRREVAVHLMLTNYGAGRFDPALVDTLVLSPDHRSRAIATLSSSVRKEGLSGVMVDFERIPPGAHPAILTFLRELRAAIADDGAVLSVAIPASAEDAYPVEAYAAVADYVMPMLYDEHAGTSPPGAIAGEAWFTEQLEAFAARVPPAQLLAGLGQYGYHWQDGRTGVTVSSSEGLALARTALRGPWFSADEREPYAVWRDAAGVRHEAWYLDGVTGWNQGRAALAAGAAGLAVWRLGSEDPALWDVLGRRGFAASPAALARLTDDGVSVLAGDGEVLAVSSQAGEGRRALVTAASGDVLHATVTRPPGGYVVERVGSRAAAGGAGPVVLTFDDGPDPTWTPRILDTLAARGAVASFFVIGRAVVEHPALARRIVREGHEIGNHTFSHPELAGLSPAAVRMEIAAAGRVIEAVTGRRPRLFRPPYLGDARPATAERLVPMVVATELGLRTAALENDTRDWLPSTPETIVRRALDALGDGRVILLHDAGGDRTATVAAIGPLIDSLRARGHVLTTVAGLLDAPATEALPPVARDEQAHRVLDGLALTAGRALQWILVVAFAAALVLGVLRLGLIVALSSVDRWQRRRTVEVPLVPDLVPPVSVVVPAFNEARVIARTVASLLAQGYPRLEVIVVDDGSTDGTADAAATAASGRPDVRVVRQANGGKASALMTGFAAATAPIVVVVDADTILAPDAIRHLVRPLADPRVAAVAGNAKVGNRVNLVTRWQSLEYVTSQNLDRRALAQLNAITVVPGAIGAWRREAVLAAGGFASDTLAEDQDLTIALLRRGHRIVHAPDAIAWTEAPESFRALGRQRFRWSFGTLQCAWKHRAAFGRPTGLGLAGLPNAWLFQLLFPLLAPAADVALLAALVRWAVEAPALGAYAAWGRAAPVVVLYTAFLLVDIATALVGIAFERGERWGSVLLAPLQRVAYRQILYVALVRAMLAALRGWTPAWGKLERTGRVRAPQAWVGAPGAESANAVPANAA